MFTLILFFFRRHRNTSFFCDASILPFFATFSRNSLWIPGGEICPSKISDKGEREKISESKRPTEILDSRRASFFDYRGVIFATLDEWMRHYCELFKATFCRFDSGIHALKMRAWSVLRYYGSFSSPQNEDLLFISNHNRTEYLYHLSEITFLHQTVQKAWFSRLFGVFEPFSRKADKENCKFETQKCKSMFEVWLGTFHTHKPLLRRMPLLCLQ